ncbi:uncharacterized protein LOC107003815 [Solanum pennellii]|uniref:Uncharacterized protein LOC107003815 n=1 Tax=Solanum pennellii TaxID=28526 RepID=A0ABM1FJ17_SOLPN|nr:uncharacterized protein LOC107003815 [Solanum pennellii]
MSYDDYMRRNLEFEKDDKEYLKISSMKGVVRCGKKLKLSPRYVGTYEILQRVGKVAYELKLPSELASVHPVFHVSMFKKCINDIESILPIEGLGVQENVSYEEVPIEILDTEVKRLKEKEGGIHKGVMEESPSCGCTMGGRGWHEVLLP